jgi:hypothetical protein
MYENKDISTLPAMQWGLMHEATALSGYLKKFEETHRAVEVIRQKPLFRKRSFDARYVLLFFPQYL